jgi:hypothetical protein
MTQNNGRIFPEKNKKIISRRENQNHALIRNTEEKGEDPFLVLIKTILIYKNVI